MQTTSPWATASRSPRSTGRVAVVTGGAAGIGQAFAVRMAGDGHAVAVADITDAVDTEKAVRGVDGEFFSGHCDVSDSASVNRFAESVIARYGRVDILVHNAGIYPMGSFDDTDWSTWRRIMDINLDSMFHLAKAFLPGMKSAGWGRIVAMASTTFHSGSPGLVAYTASKGGLIGFVRSLAAEVGEQGVTVNAIAPAIVRTPGTSAGPQDELGVFDFAVAAQAIKRVGRPADLVGSVSFLTSDDADFITGQTLVVDGGWARA